MKVKDLMTNTVVKIDPEESVEVAARTLTHYNIGALPVCNTSGKLCGLVTDRDLVTRCLALNGDPAKTTVRQVMTSQIISVPPDMDAEVAACLMGTKKVRRLPVMENGQLCGMVSLGDVACRQENHFDAADALSGISSNVTEGNKW